MIAEFVKKFDEGREALLQRFREEHPQEYKDVVRAVIETVSDASSYDSPDPERIHVIDDGDYQGTFVFVIACRGSQPSTYWAVKVYYGSCGGCDTLQDIQDRSEHGAPPTDDQAKDYFTLALHIVQGLREIGGEA